MEPQNNNTRFSENKFIELLSKTNTYVAVGIYIVAAIFAFGLGYNKLHTSLWTKFAWVLIGFIVFSLIEYVVHRYVYHYPKIGPFSNVAFKLHDFHHHHPKDKKRLAMPIPVAILIALFLLSVFWLIIGDKGLFLFSGFMLGYAGYLLIHYLIHILGPVNKLMKYLWIHHSVHHFKDDSRAYGVSSPLWDWVFRSMPSKEQTKFR